MLIPGTQMHIVTFIFVCIELVIFFYLLIYKLARPDDKTTTLNIILIVLLIIFNVTCYFPFYVYKAFGLEKMRFQAYKGVFLCLVLPYIVFVILFAVSHSLD